MFGIFSILYDTPCSFSNTKAFIKLTRSAKSWRNTPDTRVLVSKLVSSSAISPLYLICNSRGLFQ